MICIKSRLVKDRAYMSVYITKIVKQKLIKSKLVNVYVYSDIERKKMIFFDTKTVSRKKSRFREQYLIRLFPFRKAPLLYRSIVFVCIEEIDKYTKRM